jgi:predicted phage tail protein
LRSGTITITPSKTGWIFTPASHEVTLTISNVTGIDFEVNPTLPVIANMNPDMKYTGNPDFTLTVNGSGFVSTSVVRWNGADRSTTFVTPNQLTANISAGDIATAGTDIVSVFTPAPGGGTSNSVTFYKTGTGTGPAIPVLSVPIANANLSLRTPSLTVVAASKAVKYQYQVSPVATFDTLKVNEIVALTRYTITSAQALDWGYDYFWRVRSIDLSGKRSDWSAARKFTVTIQVSPVNGATFTSKRPIFKWFLSNTRLIHHIQISTDPGFTSLVLDKYTKPGSANTFSIALPNGTYYWRMRYKVADGWSVFMPFWTFTVNRK